LRPTVDLERPRPPSRGWADRWAAYRRSNANCTPAGDAPAEAAQAAKPCRSTPYARRVLSAMPWARRVSSKLASARRHGPGRRLCSSEVSSLEPTPETRLPWPTAAALSCLPTRPIFAATAVRPLARAPAAGPRRYASALAGGDGPTRCKPASPRGSGRRALQPPGRTSGYSRGRPACRANPRPRCRGCRLRRRYPSSEP
jgi:hypothetical protein